MVEIPTSKKKKNDQTIRIICRERSHIPSGEVRKNIFKTPLEKGVSCDRSGPVGDSSIHRPTWRSHACDEAESSPAHFKRRGAGRLRSGLAQWTLAAWNRAFRVSSDKYLKSNNAAAKRSAVNAGRDRCQVCDPKLWSMASITAFTGCPSGAMPRKSLPAKTGEIWSDSATIPSKSSTSRIRKCECIKSKAAAVRKRSALHAKSSSVNGRMEAKSCWPSAVGRIFKEDSAIRSKAAAMLFAISECLCWTKCATCSLATSPNLFWQRMTTSRVKLISQVDIDCKISPRSTKEQLRIAWGKILRATTLRKASRPVLGKRAILLQNIASCDVENIPTFLRPHAAKM